MALADSHDDLHPGPQMGIGKDRWDGLHLAVHHRPILPHQVLGRWQGVAASVFVCGLRGRIHRA
jgi:hypothetical protein